VVEYRLDYPLVILITGGIIILTMQVKSWLKRTGVPPLVGYLILGFMVRLIDDGWGFMGPGCRGILGFLAKLGLITLLFRVGLESNLRRLLSQLQRASMVWICDVILSGLAGFLAAYYLLNTAWITSLIVAVAFTATSVGISVAVWEEAGALNSKNGALLIDVAEMDDISAVVLMAMLFSVLPALKGGGGENLLIAVPKTVLLFLLKLGIFGAFCFLFSRYAEKAVTGYFKRIETSPDPMIVLVAIGFLIAAAAALLDFSLAIGAFFAGLLFSRDPEAVKMEASFLPLYDLFGPFFFIGIGLDMDPVSLKAALAIGGLLSFAAIAGKIIADGFPVWQMAGPGSGVLIGVSMVPRAEISMVIMQRGLNLGEWAVPPGIFGAMVVVTAVTSIFSPLVTHGLLKRWPQLEPTS
jgi:Kef-type K+ transport system membrane component KefB